jgi:hypothetical protein
MAITHHSDCLTNNAPDENVDLLPVHNDKEHKLKLNFIALPRHLARPVDKDILGRHGSFYFGRLALVALRLPSRRHQLALNKPRQRHCKVPEHVYSAALLIRQASLLPLHGRILPLFYGYTGVSIDHKPRNIARVDVVCAPLGISIRFIDLATAVDVAHYASNLLCLRNHRFRDETAHRIE